MKAFELFSHLENSEKGRLEKQLRDHHRANLIKLLRLFKNRLKEGSTPPSKEELHCSLFNTSYQEKNDYLVRNELRHFTEVIKNFLVKEKLQKQLREDPHFYAETLVSALAEKGLKKHLDVELKKSAEKAKANNAYESAANMIELYYINSINTSGPPDKAFYEYFRDLAREAGHLREKEMKEKILAARMKQAFCENQLFEKTGTRPPTEFKNSLSLAEDDLSSYERYLYYRINAYQYRGEGKIAHLNKALDVLDSIKYHPKIEANKLRTYFYFDIGREYFIIEDFEKAYNNYILALDASRENQVSPPPFLYFTCIMGFLKKGDYKRVITTADFVSQHFIKNPYAALTALVLKSFAMIFMGDKQNVKSVLREIDTFDPGLLETPYTPRLLWLMVYFVEDEHELAANKILNLENAMLNKSADSETITLTRNFRKLIKIREKLIYQKSNSTLRKLQELHEQFTKMPNPFSKGNYLHYCYEWLHSRIGELKHRYVDNLKS